MQVKKLMILGGSRYVIPVIKAAHEIGAYVITCDYLPNNIAHKYSDEYCNVSVVDKEAVLEEAKKRNIDGIVSFACDPGVVTAAYVAEMMGLPFQGSYESVCILQDKGLFREFLMKNQFNCPKVKRYTSIADALKDAEMIDFPIIVKPVDSAGSKGVTKVDGKDGLEEAAEIALNNSIRKAFIVEEFLIFKGAHSSTDVFTIDGDVEFITFSDQLFDDKAENPYTPTQIIWPSSMEKSDQEYLIKEIQRLMKLLNMKTGIYNIETCVGKNGKPYIMEVSPRGGGCKIAELQTMAYGVNLIEKEVQSALGIKIDKFNAGGCDGCWCESVIHTREREEGLFEELIIQEDILGEYVKKIDLSVQKGDYVRPFTGANQALGDIFLRFDNRSILDHVMKKEHEWLHIKFQSK